MFDLVSTNRMIQMMDKSMTLSTQRMGLVASNLANIDTPGFHTRDFDFKKALANELAHQDGDQLPIARTNPQHLNGTSVTELPATSDAIRPSYERNDGNDVSLDRENMVMAKTQLMYQLGSSVAQAELRKIYQVVKATP